MIPLRDTIRSSTVPYVNYSLIAACAGAFLYELSLGPGLDRFIIRHAVVPATVAETLFSGTLSLSVIGTLITSMFLHGGWLHLIGNMLYLYVFGDNVEDRLGHGAYLVFYLLCGAGAELAEAWFQPASGVPMIGASGAIAGVLGAYFLLYPRARVLTLIPLFVFFPLVEISAFFFLGFWFILQFLNGSLSQEMASGGVAWWAHIGGFLAGALLLPLFLLTSRRRSHH
jgi:hypothetical protein